MLALLLHLKAKKALAFLSLGKDGHDAWGELVIYVHPDLIYYAFYVYLEQSKVKCAWFNNWIFFLDN